MCIFETNLIVQLRLEDGANDKIVYMLYLFDEIIKIKKKTYTKK